MTATVQGGKKAAIHNKSRYGEDFYQRIGALGGRKSSTGGFHGNHELAVRAGRLGGLASKRSTKILNEEIVAEIRQRISDGEYITNLAPEYDISRAYVYRIHNGVAYPKNYDGSCVCYLCERKRSPTE